MFFARSASFLVMSKPLSASTVSVVRLTGVHARRSRGCRRQRVAGVADLVQGALGELVGVDDERPAAPDVVQVDSQGRRVHRHQHVGGIAGGLDGVVGEVQLEGADAGQGPGRGADLGGEVGQRGQVVAERRRSRG